MGSAARYWSAGKTRSQIRWAAESRAAAVERNKRLTVFWLSNDEFTDIDPLIREGLFRKVYVPEIVPQSLVAKRVALGQRPDLSSVVQLSPRKMDVYEHLVYLAQVDGVKFDVMNLDYCIHYSAGVELTIGSILRNGMLRNNGLLFLTVSQRAQINQNKELRFKVIGAKLERVEELVLEEIARNGWVAESIPDFPFEYQNKNAPMFSFGWKLRRLTARS